MVKNKKGEMGKAIIGLFIIIVFLLLVFVPLYTNSVDDADRVSLACNDAVLDTLNTTSNLCFNGTHMSVTEAPSEEGLTASQETILLIVPTFMVLGLLFLGARKFGFLGNN